MDNESLNIEKDAQHMADTLRLEVDTMMKTIKAKKSKEKIIAKAVTISYHYLGCQVSIIECLKAKHNYIASNINLSGTKHDIIQSFDISYSTPYVKATLRIGNQLQAGLEFNDAEVISNIVTTEVQMTEYNAEFKLFYQKLYNKETIQTYSQNLLENCLNFPCPPKAFSIIESYNINESFQRQLDYVLCQKWAHPIDLNSNESIEQQLKRMRGGDFFPDLDEETGLIRMGALDANKAYASNMLQSACLVTFPPYANFLEKSIKITSVNIQDEIKDYNLYRVNGQMNGDIKAYLMFDKKDIIYYGFILKEILVTLPDFTFQITGVCEAYKVVKLDWSNDIKRLYANPKLSTIQKKAIPNVLLGSCDKYKSRRITGECFYSKKDADASYNISEAQTRVQIPKKKDDSISWEECKKEVMSKLEEQLENDIDEELDYKYKPNYEYDCQPPTRASDSIDTYFKTNNMYQKKLYKLHINVIEQKESTFNQGFLPFSVMKYNLQRLSLLKMWDRIEKTGTLLPFGVKTDSIFVAENNLKNRTLLNKALNKEGFKGYSESK